MWQLLSNKFSGKQELILACCYIIHVPNNSLHSKEIKNGDLHYWSKQFCVCSIKHTRKFYIQVLSRFMLWQSLIFEMWFREKKIKIKKCVWMFQPCKFHEASILPPGVLACLSETGPVCDWGKDKLKLLLLGHY